MRSGLDILRIISYVQHHPIQTIAEAGAGAGAEELAMADYEHLRQRHLADLAVLMPEHVQRLRWPAERLRQERRDRLRDLLAWAKSSSPWHRDRLAGVDPGGFEEADLAGLPPMTKDDLMANWDGVVTDPRLTLGPGRGPPGRPRGRRLPVRPFPRRRLRRLHRAPGDLRLRLAGMGGGLRRLPADQRLGPGGHARAGRRRPHADRHGRGQERHPHDQRAYPRPSPTRPSTSPCSR